MNYLYNGVELPALPEYDATRYRYSFIYLRNNGVYHFFALTSNIEYSPDGTDGNDIVTVRAGIWVQYRLYDLSGEWTFFSENDHYATLTTCDIEAGDKLIWSSHDVIDTTDNSLYLAASEPIPVGSEPEKPTTFTPDPISMTLGWLVGRRIAAQRGKIRPDIPDVPDVPSGVYDDTIPIQWNALDVQDNPAQIDLGDGEVFVKISNLSPGAETLQAGVLRATVDGETFEFTISYAATFDVGSVVSFSGLEDFQVHVASVTSTQASTDLEGLTFPETGLYVLSSVIDDISFTLEFSGEVPKVFFDTFPIDISLSGLQLGFIAALETFPLVDTDGNTHGSLIKIASMTPSLEELNSTYNSYLSVYWLDGVYSVGATKTLTAAWDSSGEFVDVGDRTFWVVYETRTIHTTPFDLNTPVTIDVTPGIYMTDEMVLSFFLSIAGLINLSQNDTNSDDGIRIFLGTAEDAEKALAEYETE